MSVHDAWHGYRLSNRNFEVYFIKTCSFSFIQILPRLKCDFTSHNLVIEVAVEFAIDFGAGCKHQ